MGDSIIKQPDGKYALFSSVVDAFTVTDATPEEIIEYYIEDYKKEITKSIHKRIEKIDNGDFDGYLHLTWKEAVEIHNKNSDPKERLCSNREMLDKKLMKKGGK